MNWNKIVKLEITRELHRVEKEIQFSNYL